MPEVLRLKVPKDKYLETLDQLGKQLDQLDGKKNELLRIIDRLEGDTFGGSDVESAKVTAQETLKRVESSYNEIVRQRTIIQDYLTSTETDARTLDTEAKNIQSKLPDLFD